MELYKRTGSGREGGDDYSKESGCAEGNFDDGEKWGVPTSGAEADSFRSFHHIYPLVKRMKRMKRIA